VRGNKTKAGYTKQLDSCLCYCGAGDIGLNVFTLAHGFSGLSQSSVKLSRAAIVYKAGI
jgi:hypothetical protein